MFPEAIEAMGEIVRFIRKYLDVNYLKIKENLRNLHFTKLSEVRA